MTTHVATPGAPSGDAGVESARASHAAATGAFEDDDVRDEPQSAVPAWRVHDRTHVELAVSYPIGEGGRARWTWEAYFFVPESFRLDHLTYGKEDLYGDFKSYVRLAVPSGELAYMAGEPAERLEQIIAERPPDRAVRELQRFASRVRRAAVDGVRRIEAALPDVAEARALVDTWLEGATRVTQRYRRLLSEHSGTDDVAVALRWVDEDVSLVLETLLGRLTQRVRTCEKEHGIRCGDLPKVVVAGAVAEASYRRHMGYTSVAAAHLDASEIERLEFRRHTLKRFVASVLWLDTEIYEPGRWAEHVLFALAAGVAMSFAVVAALWQGPAMMAGEQLPLWLCVAIIAYAIKDRIKATLQDVFKGVLSRHFPDRRWRIRKRGIQLCRVDEHSGFARFERLPPEVLAARRITRSHTLEEQARPETVVWHNKTFDINAERLNRADGRYEGMLEVFRLDLSRWLTHTDDPKNRLLLANPDRGVIDDVEAPRVYNIAVVYRMLRHGGASNSTWQRARIVVSRKGVRRIDLIGPA